MDKLYNAIAIQFEQTSVQPLNDNSCIMRSKISDDFYIYQSFGFLINEKYGDQRIRPFVSFIADGGNGVCAEWEPQYGPIQIWKQCSEDWVGETSRGNPIKPRKHWHYEYVEDESLNWSQLAVDESDLKRQLGRGNLEYIKQILLEWCNR